VLLGTGTPNADPDRSGPAVAIMVHGTPYLVDCGPGVVRRAAAAYRAGVAGLKVTNLKRLFITHLHSDHTVGYPDAILTPWVLGRAEPLAVYGPAGLRAMTDHILEAYKEDIHIRLDGFEQAQPEGWKVNVHEIEPGIIYTDDHVTIRAFPVRHGSWDHAFGFRFETADRTVVISGDTAPTQTLIDNAKGCDVLIHEVYSQAGFAHRSPKWQRYHSSFHTSSRELARIAQEVQPGLLVLYHQLLWGTTEDELLDEIRETYDGKVVSGRDLDVF
jgi:ribonuclease BN (tRNA processing enzyme)